MSTPTETVTEALHLHVSAALATIDAGLPSDRALREPTGDAMTAEVMLMQEVMYGGPLTRQGLEVAAHRALASLAQHRDDIARVLARADYMPESQYAAYHRDADAVLAYLTGEAS